MSENKLPQTSSLWKSFFWFLGGSLSSLFVLWKFREPLIFNPLTSTWSSWQQSLVDYEIKKRKTESYFEKVCSTSNTAVIQSLKAVEQKINSIFPVPSPSDLKNLKNDPEKKRTAWETFKIISFSRTLTGLYGICFLSVIRRIQYSLMSRYVYLDYLKSNQNTEDSEKEKMAIGSQIQNSFLSLDHFVSKFIPFIAHHIEHSVIQIIEETPLQKSFTEEELNELFDSIRKKIENTVSTSVFPSPFDSSIYYNILPSSVILTSPNPTPENSDPSCQSKEEKNQTNEDLCDEEQQQLQQMILNSLLKEIHTILQRPKFSLLMKKVISSVYDFFKTQMSESIRSKTSLPLANIILLLNKEFSYLYEVRSSMEEDILSEKRIQNEREDENKEKCESDSIKKELSFKKGYLVGILSIKQIENFSIEIFVNAELEP